MLLATVVSFIEMAARYHPNDAASRMHALNAAIDHAVENVLAGLVKE